jgi:hypothetical protein
MTVKNTKEVTFKSSFFSKYKIAIIVSVFVVLLIVGVGFAALQLAKNVVNQKIDTIVSSSKNISNSEFIKKSVSAAKILLDLPKQIDEVTTLVDITAEENALRYKYQLSLTETTDLSSEKLKEVIKDSICSSTELKQFFNKNIDLEYEYNTNTSKQYFFKYSAQDCK